MSIADPASRVRRILQIVLGALLLTVGVLFAAAPAAAAIDAVQWTAWIALGMGVVQIVAVLKFGNNLTRLIPALFWAGLGLTILALGPDSVRDMPFVAVVWLAAYGLFRLLYGISMNSRREHRGVQSMAIGILCLAVAGFTGFSTWFDAMGSIGIAVSVGAFVYGFILIIDAGERTPVETPLLIRRQDKEIAQIHNAEYREFEKELKEKKD